MLGRRFVRYCVRTDSPHIYNRDGLEFFPFPYPDKKAWPLPPAPSVAELAHCVYAIEFDLAEWEDGRVSREQRYIMGRIDLVHDLVIALEGEKRPDG